MKISINSWILSHIEQAHDHIRQASNLADVYASSLLTKFLADTLSEFDDVHADIETMLDDEPDDDA